MRYVLTGLGILAALVALLLIVGWSLPVAHVASLEREVAAPPDRVFSLISRVEQYPRWRTGVTRVEVLGRADDAQATRFREHGPDGEILFDVVARSAPGRLVTRIADPSLPFGGEWTFELAPAPGGTRLRITEHGEVYNPIFRFVSRFVMGHTRSIERYLADVDQAARQAR